MRAQDKMRKVTEQIVSAFLAGQRKSNGSTMTDGERLFLHGNRIAKKTAEGIYVTTCGWNTPTTRDRLNAIPGVRVHNDSRKGGLHLNGKPWDGSLILVG